MRRALQALSSLYVERRGRQRFERAFESPGKRAAFALFFGSLHFLLTREVVRSLEVRTRRLDLLLELGCGTGASGAAWALESNPRPMMLGVDRSGWAVQETRWTWRKLGLSGTVHRESLSGVRLPGRRAGVLVAYTANELEAEERERLREGLVAAAERGAAILVIEPLSRRAVPWWNDWSDRFQAHGGRDDRWRFKIDLPPSLRRLDRAAGLDHRELTARSLWLYRGTRG